jgi:hypothetical protein
MPSPYLCERFHPTRGCVSLNFRPETTFSKVAGRVRTADLQTRRLPLNPLLHGGLTTTGSYDASNSGGFFCIPFDSVTKGAYDYHIRV